MAVIRRSLLLLLSILALFCLATAENGDSIFKRLEGDIFRRQNTPPGTGVTPSPTPSPTSAPDTSSATPPTSTPEPETSTPPPPESSTPPPNSEPTTSTAPPPSPSETQPQTSAPAPTSDAPAPTTAPAFSTSTRRTVIQSVSTAVITSDGSTITSLTTAPATVDEEISFFTSALVTSATEPFTTTFVTTIDGTAVTSAVTSSRVVASTTGFATITSTPSLHGQSEDGASSGLSESSKRVIGGVVGGIGGAILLGGVALVAWRLRKKRNAHHDDDDNLTGSTAMGGTDYEPVGRKSDGGMAQTGPTPFQNTLEGYHQPGRMANAGTNF